MFGLWNKLKNAELIKKDADNNDDDALDISTGVGFATTKAVTSSTLEAAKTFAKPTKYDRSLLDNGAAKRNIKIDTFRSGVEIRDPYTGDTLTLTKAEARIKYGDDWTKHLAEADHKISLEQRYEQTKNNPWLTNDNIKTSSNSSENLEVVSRKFNNAKRSKSNKDFVTDNEYLEKTGVKLSKQGKDKAIESEKKAQNTLRKQDFKDSTTNIIKTGHSAGKAAAQNAGVTAATMSGILNITAVIKGEKSAEDAIVDTVVDTGKAATTGYIMGGGLTTISNTLSGSSSKFIQALSKSSVPGKAITAVILMGDTFKRYGNGEISTQECLIELGEKGLTFITTKYSMIAGQVLIPIPIVGAAVGALVGSMLTSNYYNQLITALQTKELEHQERLRIIVECERATQEIHAFREELEGYLASYFKDYKDCFDDALSTIHLAFEAGDVDGVISGANQISRKLGATVHYDDMNQFKEFILEDSTDIL